ncbi:MAG: metallophosphoesterase [Fimbriimonadaceae bacterium]|nr:metallophosphoesterase [Fimbriimonadaceae bacterium]
MRLDRRALLTAGLASAGLPSLARAAEPRRVLRLAHLTDCHIQPGPGESGLVQCLHHVQAQTDRPTLILNGGDSIMDCFGRDEAATKTQWTLWQTLLRNECSLPLESCIGNHDVWGGHKGSSKTTGEEPLWGKRWALQVHGLSERYRSFDRAGWHFVVLDSTYLTGHGYLAKLDEPQFEWLAADLAAVPATTPVLVLSHQPILAACAYFDGQNEKSETTWQVPGAWMHLDARRLKDLFVKHPNVKLCLSGHIHLGDRVDYLGVSYYCNGAVSGNWWNTTARSYQECPPGYALVDLFDDGSHRVEYVDYGWKPA